jgi:hypothetical protein
MECTCRTAHIGQDLQHLGVHLSGIESFFFANPPPPVETPGWGRGVGGERGSGKMNLGD